MLIYVIDGGFLWRQVSYFKTHEMRMESCGFPYICWNNPLLREGIV
jgi:hypothetical protein